MDGDEEVSMRWGLWFRIGRHRKPHWEGDIQATESEGERQVPPRETHSEQRGKCNISQVGRCLKCSQEKPKRQEENTESHVLEAKWNKKKKEKRKQHSVFYRGRIHGRRQCWGGWRELRTENGHRTWPRGATDNHGQRSFSGMTERTRNVATAVW